MSYSYALLINFIPQATWEDTEVAPALDIVTAAAASHTSSAQAACAKFFFGLFVLFVLKQRTEVRLHFWIVALPPLFPLLTRPLFIFFGQTRKDVFTLLETI